MTLQVTQLLGFAVGGAVVGLIGPGVALLIDAGTFLASATLLWRFVARRPAPGDPAGHRPFWASSVHGARLIARTPGLGPLFVLGMLAGLYIAPEGLAAAWVAELHAPTETVGLLMAAPAAGLIIGAWLFTRFLDPDRRVRATGPLAVLAGLVLMGCVAQPGLGATQVMGLLNSGVLTAQGIGVLLAGLLADRIGVADTVAIAGTLGALIAIPAGVAWNRAAG